MTENNSANIDNESKDPPNENSSNETYTSRLAENLLAHYDDWKYACDDFTRQYTYDDVEATGVYLYSAEAQGNYYFSVQYCIVSGRLIYSYFRYFYVSDDTFEYLESSTQYPNLSNFSIGKYSIKTKN